MLTKDKVLKGRYRVIDRLGHSEASAVYEAYDSIRKANVALKEIFIDSEKVPAINEREILKRTFADRAKVLAEVKHESLPQIRGYFSEFDRQYLVMELITGDDASELLAKNEKPINFSDMANWADQLLDTLDYLHTLAPPIVHSDIKPQNVKLNSRGRIKLLGFDITENAEAKVKTIVTNQNADPESLAYSSLEQFVCVIDADSRKEFTDNHKEKAGKVLNQQIDARSDNYALGATLYHLVTGQIPVDALERTLAVWAEEFDPLPSANELNSSVPVEISNILVKAMEIEPEKRFGSAMEMRQALQTAVARAQERAVEEAKSKEADAAREMLLAEEKKLEQERLLIEQERLRLEEERREQAELIQNQLKMAEAERLKAEQRAAEAEKQLKEEKTLTADDKKTASLANSSPNSIENSHELQNSKKSGARETAVENYSELFSESPSSKKSSWLMPAAIVFFLLISAAVSVWVFRSPNNVAAESNQPTEGKTVSAPDNPAAPSNQPTPTIEKISTTATLPAATTETVSPEKTINQPAPKTKPLAPQQTRVEKPVKTAKAPANQKKTVTVDDLIGGN